MRYELLVYEDAHDDDPVRAGQADSAKDILRAVLDELGYLHQEPWGTFLFGEAGADELFEVFPEPGYGTVVVREL